MIEMTQKSKITIFIIFTIPMVFFYARCFERNALFTYEDIMRNELHSLEIIPSSAVIPLGIEYTLTAIARYQDGTTKDITAHAHWESADPLIVEVNSAGRVTGTKPGFSTITAFYEGFSDTTTVEISSASLVSIDIAPANPSTPEGLTCQFTATGYFSDSSNINLTQQVSWSSSNYAVAAISNSDGSRGLATAVSIGTASISAELNGISNATVFTVTPAELVFIEIEPANPKIQKTKSLQLKVYGHYTNSDKQDITQDAAWTSSNASVLTVSDTPGSKGLATGVAIGQSTVTASYAGLQGTTLVNVTELVLTKWVNNGIDEPRVIASTDAKFTLSWPVLENAVNYELYYVTKWDPLEETKFMQTSGTQFEVTENTKKNLRIKAKDAADSIVDTWVIQGSSNSGVKVIGYYVLIPDNFVSGSYYYEFDEPSLPAIYYKINPDEIVQSSGYVQLNQNVTDNGPAIYIGYNSNGKRYVHTRFKYFQHRANEYYGGIPIQIISYMNKNTFFGVGNYHEVYTPHMGTNYRYTDYNVNNYTPFYEIWQQIHTNEYFDTWITWDFKIDLALGAFTVELLDSSNASVFVQTINTGRHYGDKIFLMFNPFGWWTGHYVRIDDLLIESSDTPY